MHTYLIKVDIIMLHFGSSYLYHAHMQSITLKLLGTSHCHLCEEAEHLLATVLVGEKFQYNQIVSQKIDVLDDDNLYEKYGIHIPVIQIEIQNILIEELYWPFDSEMLRNMLQRTLPSA